jgi:hypothetical protein
MNGAFRALLPGTAIAVLYLLYPKEPAFENRSAIGGGHGFQLLVRRPLSPLFLYEHSDVDEKVLLIRTIDVVEQMADVLPAAILQRALLQGGIADTGAMNKTLRDWLVPLGPVAAGYAISDLKIAWAECLNKSNCLNTAPFRLLAVVFRPDLAHFRCGSEVTEGSQVCDAEIRFDFGLVDTSGNQKALNLIFEFVLAPRLKADFQNLVSDWMKLKDATDLPTALRPRLNRDVFDPAALAGARVRISAQEGAEQPWDLYEYHFTGGIQQTDLDGEISPSWRGAPCTLSSTAASFVSGFDWKADRVVLADGLKTNQSQIPPAFRVELGKNVTGDQNVKIRSRLALNTCSGCHSIETGMFGPFNQIHHREQGKVSALSPFLTGATSGYGNPTMTGYHQVHIDFSGPDECGSQPEDHQFNDLLRRELYIQTLLTLSPSNTDWTTQLRGLAAYEAH